MIAPVYPSPAFQIGQLIQHRRYGYRGVIVGLDRYCRAPEEWYIRNQTQPDRNQAWYHVLVHERDSVTYAAESSLELDELGTPIEHPLLDHFFSDFVGNAYVRNEQKFPDWK